MIGEGDLDPSEGQSQPLVGTLPLTEKDPPEKSEDKDPPPSSSAEGLDIEAHDEKDESTTPSSPGSSDKTEATPTSPIRTRVSTEYPPKDIKDPPPPPTQSKLKKGSEGHLPKTTEDISLRDPFSSFWSGKLGDVSDQSGRRHRWLIRKPKRRHSIELELLDEKGPRPYKYVLEGDRPFFTRQRFYSSHLDARDITFQQANFTLRHIVQQRLQEIQQEELEREKRQSEKRRQVLLLVSSFRSLSFLFLIINRPRRLIPVEPILSPFEIERRKVPGEDPLIPQLPFEKPKSNPKALEDPLVPKTPKTS